LVPVSSAVAERNLARKVLKLEKLVKNIKPESKIVDVSLVLNNIVSATGAVIHLNPVAAGTGISGRTGEKILVREVQAHIEAFYTGSIAATINDNPTWRVYIAVDKQQIGDTAPTCADLVDSVNTPVDQMSNDIFQNRFRILYDSGPQMMVAGPAGTVSLNVPSPGGHFHLHCKRSNLSIPVEYNGTASSDIQKNGIFLFITTDMIGAAGVAVLDVTGQARCRYTDV
jgi:hypothetical protein